MACAIQRRRDGALTTAHVNQAGVPHGADGIATRSRGSSLFYGTGSGIIFVSVEVPTYGLKP
jgi:hypothetical protein